MNTHSLRALRANSMISGEWFNWPATLTSFAPIISIQPNQLAFGSLNANQRSTKSVDLEPNDVMEAYILSMMEVIQTTCPDPFGGGAYNLQSISATSEKGSGSRDYVRGIPSGKSIVILRSY